MKEYKKEKARNLAIKWQSIACRGYRDMSYFVKWHAIFEKIGRKYGLIREFKENAIL